MVNDRGNLRRAGSVVLLAVLLGTLGSLAFAAYEVQNRGLIYYGNPDRFSKPGVVVASMVFEHIPEYKEIKERGLTQEDPEYWILLEKANRRFYQAVAKVARAKGLDLVGEVGAIVATEGEALPDITQAVINKVRG